MRSIEQYKEAMENIRVSDSFYERTELLLKENAETEQVEVNRKRSGIKYAGFAMIGAAAACAALVLTLDPKLLKGEPAVEETVQEVTQQTVIVSEITPANETIYIELEEDDQIYTISPAAEPEPVPATEPSPEYDAAAEEASPTAEYTPEEIVEEAVTEHKLNEFASTLAELDLSQCETVVKSYLNYGLTAENGGYVYEDGGYVEEAAPSGLNTLVLDAKTAAQAVEMTADAVYYAPAAPKLDVRMVEFRIEISDFDTDERLYEITLNTDKTISVTAYYGQEKYEIREYIPADPDFIELEKYLFLKFGSMAQYERFIGI